jgi:hypothetical protein
MNTAFHRLSPVRARVLAGTVLLAVIGAVAAAPAASAVPASPASPVSAARPGQPASGAPAGTISWSVEPASATAPDTRTIFSYQNIEPGSTITDHVAVFNRSSVAVAFLVYATDASGTSASGALTLLPGNQRPRDIGAWVTFPGHKSGLSVVIGADKGIIEPFTITVPLRATPGDHIGGMIAAVAVLHRTASGTAVTLTQRIAVPMELRVTGKLVAALSVQSVSVGFHNPFNPFGGGSARVTYSVVNTGNVMLAGTQAVTITGPFGAKSTIRMHALPVILPGDSIQYSASSGGLYPAGSIGAHVTLTPGWPAGATHLPVALVSASGSSSAFEVPWALLVLLIVLGGGGFGWRRASKGRRLRHQAEIAMAAEQARKETERRLLGGSNGKSGPKSALESAKSDAPAAKPAKPAASPTKPAPSATKSADSAAKPAESAAEPAESAGKPAKPGQPAASTTKLGGPAAGAAKPAQPSGTTQTASPNGAGQPE